MRCAGRTIAQSPLGFDHVSEFAAAGPRRSGRPGEASLFSATYHCDSIATSDASVRLGAPCSVHSSAIGGPRRPSWRTRDRVPHYLTLNVGTVYWYRGRARMRWIMSSWSWKAGDRPSAGTADTAPQRLPHRLPENLPTEHAGPLRLVVGIVNPCVEPWPSSPACTRSTRRTGTTGASRRQVAGSARKNFWRFRDR